MNKDDNHHIHYGRRSERITKHLILSYHELGDPSGQYDASQIKNISKGGICFLTSKQYPVSTKIEMKLKAPNFARPVVMIGVVLESKELENHQMYQTRLSFENLSLEATEAINSIYGK